MLHKWCEIDILWNLTLILITIKHWDSFIDEVAFVWVVTCVRRVVLFTFQKPEEIRIFKCFYTD